MPAVLLSGPWGGAFLGNLFNTEQSSNSLLGKMKPPEVRELRLLSTGNRQPAKVFAP